jgi:ubiquitin-like protein Pup
MVETRQSSGEDGTMSEQVRKSTSTKTSGGERETPKAALNDKGRKLGKELDALIDEIDGVLEENAAEFVDSYIQRGGQ